MISKSTVRAHQPRSTLAPARINDSASARMRNVPAETSVALLERPDPVLSPGFVDAADDDN